MPKIPLYGKGAGATVQLPTGGLAPQLSESALQAPGRAFLELGQQIGTTGRQFGETQMRIDEGQMKAEKTRQINEIEFTRRQKKIEFDFQMAERDAEDRRILAEEADAAVVATSEFLSNNRDTDTKTFNQNFDAFRTDLLKGLEAKGYDDRRRALVETAVINSTRSQRSSGASQAFGRGNLARTNAADATIETSINQMSLYADGHPERIRLQRLIDTTFQDADANGLRLKYTPQGVASAISYQDYNRQIEAASSEAAIEKVLMEVRLDRTITQGSREKLFADATRIRGVLRGDIKESVTATINGAVLTAGDQQAIEDAIDNQQVFNFEMPDGSTVPVDFSRTSSTDASGYKTLVGTNLKNVEDLSSASLLFELEGGFDQSKTGAENAQVVANLYTDENLALHGKTPAQLDDIAIGYANQHQDFVTNTIKADGVTADNYGLLVSRLDTAEEILNQQFAGRPPLRVRSGTDGSNAQKIASSIATAREDLAKAAGITATRSAIATSLEDGDGEYIVDEVKPDDMKSAVNGLMSKYANNPRKQIDLLSKNGVKYEKFETILNTQAARMTDPNFDPDGEEAADVLAGVELFKLMDLAGEGVLERHVSPDNLVRYRAFQILEPHLGASGAIRTIQRKRDQIDVNASYKIVEKQVESIRDDESAEYSWYEYIPGLGRDEEFSVQDTSAIVSYVQRLSKEYISLGVDPEVAVELAAKDYGKSHRRVRNIMVPITTDLPNDIEDMANAAVSDAMLRFPGLSDEYESDELSIANLDGTTDRWTLVYSGGYPVTTVGDDNVARVIEFSKDDLRGYMVTQRSDRGLIQRAKIEEINFKRDVMTEFTTRTGRFEGLSNYQADLLKLRLLHPERSFRLEPEDVRGFAERMEKVIEATPGAGGA
mgnify:FL=1